MNLRTGMMAALLAPLALAVTAADRGMRIEPQRACAFLGDHGLPTRGGYRASGDGFECRSRRRSLIGGGEVNNSIRYVARGDQHAVTRLTLELQVNSRPSVQRAHRQLLDYADVLLDKALGESMPGEIEASVLSAVRGEWPLGGATVALDRVSLGGPGYELRFRLH